MALPYPTKVVLPFDIATAQDMNERHANDVALANGSGLDDGAVSNDKLATGAGEPGGAWTTWTPTITGFSSTPPGGIYTYTQVGKTVTINIRMPNTGTSNSSGFTITLPVTAKTGRVFGNLCVITNSGSDDGGLLYINTDLSTTTLTVYRDAKFTTFTASGAKRVVAGQITYEAE